MSIPIINAAGVGKCYRIGGSDRYLSLREEMSKRFTRAGRRTAAQQLEFWALEEVDFAVEPGETVAIIGRNGAGKSTLLKILSRITPPTTGRITMRGRVASLLEVGTGFHPELTGRENIYLNGAILGMTRREITRKFDEIVDFAEIEKFIDTPVKRYSSGMYVRLAFAVAAHLEPEILIVDEVLAVGDAAFQRKCLGKMGDVARGGRTVLFVSHNMSAVKTLCRRAIYLERGRVKYDTDVFAVVNAYLSGINDLPAESRWDDPRTRPGDEMFRLVAMRVLDQDGTATSSVLTNQPTLIEIEFDLAAVHSALCVGFDLVASDGSNVFRSYHTDRPDDHPLRIGRNALQCVIPPGLLNAGVYRALPRVSLHCMKWILNGDDLAVAFEATFVHGESYFLNNVNEGARPGGVAPLLAWRTRTPDGAIDHAAGREESAVSGCPKR